MNVLLKPHRDVTEMSCNGKTLKRIDNTDRWVGWFMSRRCLALFLCLYYTDTLKTFPEFISFLLGNVDVNMQPYSIYAKVQILYSYVNFWKVWCRPRMQWSWKKTCFKPHIQMSHPHLTFYICFHILCRWAVLRLCGQSDSVLFPGQTEEKRKRGNEGGTQKDQHASSCFSLSRLSYRTVTCVPMSRVSIQPHSFMFIHYLFMCGLFFDWWSAVSCLLHPFWKFFRNLSCIYTYMFHYGSLRVKIIAVIRGRLNLAHFYIISAVKRNCCKIMLQISVCRVLNRMQGLKKVFWTVSKPIAAAFLKKQLLWWCRGVVSLSSPIYHSPQTEACFIPAQSAVRSLPTCSTALAYRRLWDPN